MLETTHAIVAGAIASKTGNPAAAITLSFFSHFLLDAVPHWDFGANWRGRRKLYTGLFAIADVLVGFGLTYFLFANTVSINLLLACITASMLPDWLEAPYYILFADHRRKGVSSKAGWLERCTYAVYRMENVFHHKTGSPLGVITQFAVIAFFFLLISQ